MTDPGIIRIYLRSTDRCFRDQENVRHPTSKLLKFHFVQILDTFQNPSLRIFTAAKTSLISFYENHDSIFKIKENNIIQKEFCFKEVSSEEVKKVTKSLKKENLQLVLAFRLVF